MYEDSMIAYAFLQVVVQGAHKWLESIILIPGAIAKHLVQEVCYNACFDESHNGVSKKGKIVG